MAAKKGTIDEAISKEIDLKSTFNPLIQALKENDKRNLFSSFDSLESHYKTLVRYLNFEDMGKVLGKGCGTPSMTKNSDYMMLAYTLGKNLK